MVHVYITRGRTRLSKTSPFALQSEVKEQFGSLIERGKIPALVAGDVDTGDVANPVTIGPEC